MRIPHRFSDVSAKWLTSVMAIQFKGVEVTSCELEPVAGTKQNKIRALVSYGGSGDAADLPTILGRKRKLSRGK